MRSELFSAEQLKAFFWVIMVLVVSNLGTVLGAVVQYFRKMKRLRFDLDQAHQKIRILEARFEQQLKKGEKK